MLLFSLWNERKLVDGAGAFSMIPAGHLTVFTPVFTRRRSIYPHPPAAVSARWKMCPPIKRPSVYHPLFHHARWQRGSGTFTASREAKLRCQRSTGIIWQSEPLKNFRGILTVMVTDQRVSRRACHWSVTQIVDSWSMPGYQLSAPQLTNGSQHTIYQKSQRRQYDNWAPLFSVHASLLYSSTMLRLLLEATLPTPDNPTQISTGAAWHAAAGNNRSAAAGCKLTANHPLCVHDELSNYQTNRHTGFGALLTLE